MTRRAPVFRWSTGADGRRLPICVGQLTQEASRWEFLYDPDYLSMGPAAWELDPNEIRLKQRSAFTRPGVVPFPVFCDAALSGWSLDTLHQRRAEFLGRDADPEPWGWWERLLYAPADGFGALFVGELGSKPPAEHILASALGSVSSEALAQVSLESSSGAMGGERPKIAAFARADAGGVQQAVLLKFPLSSERPDSVVAEATALTLGRQLGLAVPDHHVLQFQDVSGLCIQRFDRGPGAQGDVFHCVSAATALGLAPGTDVEDPRRSYVALRSKLRRPGDAIELFRRIVLNAAVGNTDDHPWNTSLRQYGLRAWELAPLYDVLPFFHRTGIPALRMAILPNGARAASMHNLVAAGRHIGGLRTDDEAIAMVRQVFSHVRNAWRGVFEVHARDVRDASIQDWAAVFEHDPQQAAP